MSAFKQTANAKSHQGALSTDMLSRHVACGIIVVDARGRITHCTEMAADALGVDAGQITNRHHKSLPAALSRVIRRTMTSRKPVDGLKVNLTIAGQGKRTLAASTAFLGGPAQKLGAALVVHDLTSFVHSEQNLRQLDRLATLGILSASLAHDIRNALVAGKTFFDLLLEKHQDAELVGIVRRELGRIDATVNQMLSLAGTAKPSFSAIRVHQLLDHSLRLVQPQLRAKSNSLHCAYGAPSDLINGDGVQLEQAFVNLLMNAADATGPNGSLTVATELVFPEAPRPRLRNAGDLRQLRITIKDNGVGIPPEHLDRLFEPFFTTKEGGTGLGLAITRRIIQEHGGSIGVVSRPNNGATFQILLPAVS